jgi:hypothetical protein
MARRRQSTSNTRTWDPAQTNINRMERAVINRSIRTDGITPADVVDWLVPPEPLGRLRAAYSDAETNMSGYSSDTSCTIRFPFAKITYHIDFLHCGCLPPKRALISVQPDVPKAEGLRAISEQAAHIVGQHNKLRKILQWFTSSEITAGAARHYFPTLQSLLPSDHKFFEVKGDRFRDVHIPYEIAELLREAPEIVARGVLAEPNVNGRDRPGRALVRIQHESGYIFTLMAKGE